MGFDQYHEPPEELSAETRTFARMIVSLTEEAEAINWYEQRISVEKDAAAKDKTNPLNDLSGDIDNPETDDKPENKDKPKVINDPYLKEGSKILADMMQIRQF